MAARRKTVPAALRRALINEAGGRCANPACPNTLVELHHIKPWATYQSHDEQHMIAVCPACHDAVERGSLRISDSDLYNWKTATPPSHPWGHVTIPPSGEQKLLLGSVAMRSKSTFVVFDSGIEGQMAFQVDPDAGLLRLDSTITTLDGALLLQLNNNHVLTQDAQLVLEQRPGKVRVSYPDWPNLMPLWAYTQFLRFMPMDVMAGPPLLDVEVLRAGLVRVSGIWGTKRGALVITDNDILIFAHPNGDRPSVVRGFGETTVFELDGPDVLFGINKLPGGAALNFW